MTNKNVLAAAKAIAFAGRNRHDASKDAAEFWEHTGEDARDVAMRQARAAIKAMPDALQERKACAAICEEWFGTPDADEIARIIHSGIMDRQNLDMEPSA